MRIPCTASARRSIRDNNGRITGNWLPKLARKSSVSVDWLVWLCSETPVRKPRGASWSRQRYEMLDRAMSAPFFALISGFLPTVFNFHHQREVKKLRITVQFAKESRAIPRKPGKNPEQNRSKVAGIRSIALEFARFCPVNAAFFFAGRGTRAPGPNATLLHGGRKMKWAGPAASDPESPHQPRALAISGRSNPSR